MLNPRKIEIEHSLISNGCLQVLYVSRDFQFKNKVLKSRFYSEYMDIIFVLQGNLKLIAFNEEVELSQNSLFSCTQSTYYELINSSEEPFSYVRFRFLKNYFKDQLISRFAATFVDSEMLKLQILNHSMLYIAFMENKTESIDHNQALNIHQDNINIVASVNDIIRNDIESLNVIRHGIKQNDLAVRTVNMFEETFPGEISLQKVAEDLSVSQSYFIRHFKKKVGIVPNTFIQAMRLNYSLTLLGINQMSLTDISYETGFSDQSHFSNSFKKFFQITPKKSYSND